MSTPLDEHMERERRPDGEVAEVLREGRYKNINGLGFLHAAIEAMGLLARVGAIKIGEGATEAAEIALQETTEGAQAAVYNMASRTVLEDVGRESNVATTRQAVEDSFSEEAA